ncbi:hypothetical protein [Sulfobacillus thermosulfidooxidans]|jgi:hypothetical protein|nr:hypothetical protein [Sulfobacillus thermosulfidooxidans]
MPTNTNTPQRASSLVEIIRISQMLGLYDDDEPTNGEESDYINKSN